MHIQYNIIMNKNRTTILTEPRDLELLQSLAARLGLHATRGIGKESRRGSMSALISALAAAYERDPDSIVLALEVISRKDNHE